MEHPAEKRINTEVATRDLKYYIFDWDDNILHMPTRIHLEHLGDDGKWAPATVSTSLFAVVRNDTAHYRAPAEGGWAAAFREFQDEPATGNGRQFLEDTRTALLRVAGGERPGPSFQTLRKTLREGRIFAIVTARGHAPATIEKAVRLFIDLALTPADREEMMASLRGYRAWLDKKTEFGTDAEELDYYLSMCRYHAVTNPGFKEMMAADPRFQARLAGAGTARRPEMAKEFAIRDFVEHVFHMLERTGGLGRPIAVGFSDDDEGNVRSVSDYIRAELSRRFPGIKFVVYDTGDAALAHGRKVTVSGQMDLPGFE